MRALVLGGYGLIGLEVTKLLLRSGYAVTGLARSAQRGRALIPEADWVSFDIGAAQRTDDWAHHLSNIDIVVNAAGALQDGSRDNVRAVHSAAIIALVRACEAAGIKKFVQISAPGASSSAVTPFMSSKGAADEFLLASNLTATVLRPGLVISSTAYGGTSLLRMLAAFPFVQPVVLANAQIQTIAVEDVASAVLGVVEGDIPDGQYDIAETGSHSLEDLLAAFRSWLGFQPARMIIRSPRFAGYAMAKFADAAGWLGWRSPMRTTALRVLEDGVIADTSAWTVAGGAPPKSLSETLSLLPSTLQERVFARTQLIFPVLIVLLSGFWLASGLIGLWRQDAAVSVLVPRFSGGLARTFVVGGAIVDILIGCAVLVRRWLRPAAALAMGLSLGYLIAGTIFTGHLWADPLGPFVKIIPAVGLALAVLAMSEER